MVYQDVKRFLKRHLNKPSSKYEWGNHDNFLFLNYIQDRYSDEKIENNALEIREAFRDFFEPSGNLIVRFDKATGIHYKITPYRIEVQKSKHLKDIITIIRSNRRAIEFPYNGKDDQIALLGKIRRKINAEIAETTEKVNKKELIRYAIKKAIELDDKDIILTQKKKYIIKLFNKNTFVHTDSQLKEKIEPKKENKISQEDLKSYYDDLFSEVSISDFLDQIMISLFAEKLNFQKINNNYYEQNALNLIKNKITEDLSEHISGNDDYASLLAGYILKLNLINIHERIAIEIFEQITQKDENAKLFLNYYTGQVYVEQGKKYIIPEITTDDGKRWNINSLMSTSTVWLRTRSLYIRTKVERSNIQEKIAENMPTFTNAKKQLDKTRAELSTTLKHYKKLSEKIEDISLNLKNELKGNMDKAKEATLDKEIKNNRKVLNDIRRQLDKHQTEKKDAESVFMASNNIMNDYQIKERSLNSKINSLEQDLNLNSNAFNSILSSVVKALIKRKRKVD